MLFNEMSIVLMALNLIIYGGLAIFAIYLIFAWGKFWAYEELDNTPKLNSLIKKTVFLVVFLLLGSFFSSYFFSYGPKLVNITPITSQSIDRELLEGPIKDLTPQKNNPIEELERLRRSTDGLVE